MIFATGFLKPTAEQVAHVRRHADDSFCAASNEGFMQAGFPTFDGFKPAENRAMLLRLKNVEPHSDPWASLEAMPRKRRSIFWLIEGGHTYERRVIHFGCGGKIIAMKAGDFVVFNDDRIHWVMSDKVWRGAAVQLVEAK